MPVGISSEAELIKLYDQIVERLYLLHHHKASQALLELTIGPVRCVRRQQRSDRRDRNPSKPQVGDGARR